MAEPQKPKAKSRHSGKTRKPPVVDLHAEKAIHSGKNGIPEAEPVAFDENNKNAMAEASGKNGKTAVAKPSSVAKAETKTSATDSAETSANRKTTPVTNREKNEVKMASDQTSRADEKNNGASTASRQQKSTGAKTGSVSHFASGVAGGVIALVLGAGLQWSGLLPAFSRQDSSTQTRLAELENRISSLKQNATDGAAITAELSSEDREALDKVVSSVGELDSKTNAMGEQLSGVIDNVETLNNVVNSLGSDNANPQAAEVLTKKFDDIQNRLQSVSAISEKSGEALDLAHKNAEDIDHLKNEIEAVKSEFKNPVQGKDIASITAANALKNAIDRGGSYASELDMLKNLAPDLTSLDNLEQYADKGVPNQAELSQEFAHVADEIARTENQPASDAGFGQKLWASAKGLVASRPVGNVEGENAPAIAARMEVAIKKGDNERALSEWQNLPQSAKDVSSDFITKLKMRRDADAVLSEILSKLMSPSKAQDLN